jgi:hypothetical protein
MLGLGHKHATSSGKRYTDNLVVGKHRGCKMCKIDLIFELRQHETNFVILRADVHF